jgi:hypothetical protein
MQDEQQRMLSCKTLKFLLLFEHSSLNVFHLYTYKPTREGAFSGLVTLLVVSSPLNNIDGCSVTGKVNLAGKRPFRQVAKDQFSSAAGYGVRTGKFSGKCRVQNVYKGRITQG